MTLNGTQHIQQQPSGLKYLKTIAALVFIWLLLGGCSMDQWAGDGRGDWTLDIGEGYCITRVNTYEILVGYKHDPDVAGSEIVIPYYFVTAYQEDDHYFMFEGIHTQKWAVSDDELSKRILIYYIIDTSDDTLLGPFESITEFEEMCKMLGIQDCFEWVEIDPITADGSLH